MKTLDTIAGHTYVVSSPNGGTVTSADGLVKETVDAGKQKVVFGTGAPLQLDDDAGKIMSTTFKRAALALGLLGGGVKSELPAGYLRAEWLESPSAYNAQTLALFDLATEDITPEDSVRYETEHYFTQLPIITSVEGWGENKCNLFWGYYPSDVGWCVAIDGIANHSTQPGNAYANENIMYSVPPPEKKWFRHTIHLTSDRLKVYLDGEAVVDFDIEWHKDAIPRKGIGVFGYEKGATNYSYTGRKRSYAVIKNSNLVNKLVPCVAVDGEVTFFDTVTKKAVPRIGAAFIAGFTLPQARKLGAHLPEGGGALTISLPTGYEQDTAVAESLETARAKGWTLTVQTYEAEAVVATFGMRRIWVRRVQDEHGAYVDADGVRWSVEWCVDMVTPDGSTPDEHGYELYRSTEAAVAYWELEPWIDPEAEQEFLTTESL